MAKDKYAELKKIAAEARGLMVETLVSAGCGHPGGAFSSIDVMTALYFSVLKVNPKDPWWPGRDMFILSKGHSSVALYTVLHLRGFFDKATLLSFRQDESALCGHPDMHKVKGVEMSTGSLGHGLSIGIGLARAFKMDNDPRRVFVLMGDGETQEGSVWEAAMFAAHHMLDNLVAIVDRNMIQIDGFTEDVLSLEPYVRKWEAFGWETLEVDGHDFNEIVPALSKTPLKPGRPTMIIARTTKGKGISFMENNPEWHGKALKGEHADIAARETGRRGEG
jgi:transketolase